MLFTKTDRIFEVVLELLIHELIVKDQNKGTTPLIKSIKVK